MRAEYRPVHFAPGPGVAHCIGAIVSVEDGRVRGVPSPSCLPASYTDASSQVLRLLGLFPRMNPADLWPGGDVRTGEPCPIPDGVSDPFLWVENLLNGRPPLAGSVQPG